MPPLVYDYPGDAISRQLDSMTLEDYFIRTYGISRETVRLMDASEAAGGFGLGPDALSAFLVYEWSKIIPTVDDSMESGIQMFPGGNSGMTRLMVKTMIPAAIEGPRSMDTVWKGRGEFRRVGSTWAASAIAAGFYCGARRAHGRPEQGGVCFRRVREERQPCSGSKQKQLSWPAADGSRSMWSEIWTKRERIATTSSTMRLT